MTEIELEKALQCWPGNWPGRQFVDLDNLGDPGFWLGEQVDEVGAILAGDDESLDEAAAMLAENFLMAAAEMSFPVPSDFGCTKDEELRMITDDFLGFLNEWCRRIKAD